MGPTPVKRWSSEFVQMKKQLPFYPAGFIVEE